MLKKVIFIFLVVVSESFAQKMAQDQSVWLAYAGQFKFSQKWGYHAEAQIRLDNELEQSIQNLYRVGAIYNLPKNQSIITGYALVKTLNRSVDDYFTENRIWQQYQINKKWYSDKNTSTHRFRLEQRWVDKIALVDEEVLKMTTNYQNRLRYLNRNLFQIAKLNSDDKELYGVLQNEVFINLGNNKVNSKKFDQNRFLIGLGLNFENKTRFELGYLKHFMTSSSSDNLLRHTVSVSLFQNLDFQK
jgi:hypothetical protein